MFQEVDKLVPQDAGHGLDIGVFVVVVRLSTCCLLTRLNERNLSMPLVVTAPTNLSYAPCRVAVCLIVFQNAWSLLVNACAASLLFHTSSG